MASTWWKLTTVDRTYDNGCDRCGKKEGQSRDRDGSQYCPDHRHLHSD